MWLGNNTDSDCIFIIIDLCIVRFLLKQISRSHYSSTNELIRRTRAMVTDSYRSRREEVYRVSDSRSLIFYSQNFKTFKWFFFKVHFEIMLDQRLLPKKKKQQTAFILFFSLRTLYKSTNYPKDLLLIFRYDLLS